MKPILFYVSGHGFGHARRMTQVIIALLRLRPALPIHVRSAAPTRIFQPLPADRVETTDIDCGLIERDPLTIDRPASLARLESFMGRRPQIVAHEAAVVRQMAAALIVADIPFLAGDVSRETGTPCIGVSNFTWDWIYDHLFGDAAAYLRLRALIESAHANLSALLELPFGQTSSAIATKLAMPLVAMKSRRSRDAVRQELGIADHHGPVALFGTRGSVPSEALWTAAAQCPQFLFLFPGESGPFPPNARGVQLSASLDFSDLMLAADVVVSKLGYGIVSECIATQKRLVWPARQGFAEDDVVAAEAPRVAPMLQMAREDYYAGRWGQSLRSAMQLPPPAQTMPTDGADRCAEEILRFLE